MRAPTAHAERWLPVNASSSERPHENRKLVASPLRDAANVGYKERFRSNARFVSERDDRSSTRSSPWVPAGSADEIGDLVYA